MPDDSAHRLALSMRQVACEVGLASADPRLAVMRSEEGSIMISGILLLPIKTLLVYSPRHEQRRGPLCRARVPFTLDPPAIICP